MQRGHVRTLHKRAQYGVLTLQCPSNKLSKHPSSVYTRVHTDITRQKKDRERYSMCAGARTTTPHSVLAVQSPNSMLSSQHTPTHTRTRHAPGCACECCEADGEHATVAVVVLLRHTWHLARPAHGVCPLVSGCRALAQLVLSLVHHPACEVLHAGRVLSGLWGAHEMTSTTVR